MEDVQVGGNKQNVTKVSKGNVKRIVDTWSVHNVTKLDVKLIRSFEKALFMGVQGIPDHAKPKV